MCMQWSIRDLGRPQLDRQDTALGGEMVWILGAPVPQSATRRRSTRTDKSHLENSIADNAAGNGATIRRFNSTVVHLLAVPDKRPDNSNPAVAPLKWPNVDNWRAENIHREETTNSREAFSRVAIAIASSVTARVTDSGSEKLPTRSSYNYRRYGRHYSRQYGAQALMY